MRLLVISMLALTLSACSGTLNHASGVAKGLIDLLPTIYAEGEDTAKSIFDKVKSLFE